MTKIFEQPLYPYTRNADQDPATARPHKAVVVGAGPVGLVTAIDLAQQGIETVVVDENDKVSWGSRAICFAKRPLEILDRLGCGQEMVDKGVVWNLGKVFFGDRQVFDFNLLPEDGHRRPAFINLQQYHFERVLVERLQALAAEGAPVELRGGNKVVSVDSRDDGVTLQVETPEGIYPLQADWLIACDGAGSPIRRMLGLDFVGRVFEDNFLIADVAMKARLPDRALVLVRPAIQPRAVGAAAQAARRHLAHRLPAWLGHRPPRPRWTPSGSSARLREMLGDDAPFELEWVSIYTFQCRRMEHFRHGRILFAGDSAHQVSPFGARGANSGLQDTDNLCWKLRLVIEGNAPESLLDSYDVERIHGADENILNSTRSTDFITPKSEISRNFRDAVLDLSERHAFARPMVNSGRLSVPCTYDGSPLNTPDALPRGPARTRPGSACPDAPVEGGFLLDRLGDDFTVLFLNGEGDVPDVIDGVPVRTVSLGAAPGSPLADRWLGEAESAVYLVRPDQHVAGRWAEYDVEAVAHALRRACGRT